MHHKELMSATNNSKYSIMHYELSVIGYKMFCIGKFL